MTDEEIKNMVLRIVDEVDTDIYKKYYDKETAEEPDLVEVKIAILVRAAKSHLGLDDKYVLDMRGTFASIKAIDEYRLQNPGANGEVYSRSGHMIDEDFARICEELTCALENYTGKEDLLQSIRVQEAKLLLLIEKKKDWKIFMKNLDEVKSDGKLPKDVLLRERAKMRLEEEKEVKLKEIRDIDRKLLQGNFVFSTNPTKEELEQAEAKGLLMVASSKDIKECVKFQERLGSSPNLTIWLDQTPVKMADGTMLDFEEFFLGPYLDMMRKNASA